MGAPLVGSLGSVLDATTTGSIIRYDPKDLQGLRQIQIQNQLYQEGINAYVANRNNEWINRDSETRRLLRNYWSLRVGHNTHYKNLRDFDDFISNLALYLQSNPQLIPSSKIQQEHSYYFIEQANKQASRRFYQAVAKRISQYQQRINEVSGILEEELRRDQAGSTCTQKFIDEL